MRINWKVWRGMWRIYIDNYFIALCTPWFQIMFSSGSYEIFEPVLWYGVRLYWSPVLGWWVNEGCFPFRKWDEFLSRRIYAPGDGR
jgi:hypothetical protein